VLHRPVELAALIGQVKSPSKHVRQGAGVAKIFVIPAKRRMQSESSRRSVYKSGGHLGPYIDFRPAEKKESRDFDFTAFEQADWLLFGGNWTDIGLTFADCPPDEVVFDGTGN